jgi:uroporphyrinogen-III synthase
MARLEGVGVLVTRPAHQAHHLCRLIEDEGGSAVRFPALEIRPYGDRPSMRAAIGPVDRYNLIIFASSNAVRYGADLLGQRRDLLTAAIGKATAHALNATGHRVALTPTGTSDSESLLAMPQLRHMAGQRVLIVRGRGGRELLHDTLVARGAEVAYADVYERLPAHPTREQGLELEQLWRHGGVNVYSATSGDLLEALLGIVTPRCRELMDSTALLTGASRVADRAARLGLGSPVIMARAPEDDALLEALVAWHEARSR